MVVFAVFFRLIQDMTDPTNVKARVLYDGDCVFCCKSVELLKKLDWLGKLDYVINGAMIGGFALVAAPAEHGVTGVKTFMVSQDGVVYEKDFGKGTLEHFRTVERFDPDHTWIPVVAD